ncbi:ATP-binding protein [Anaeromyxobacter sp. Fw109-5]|uniref:ATP-binding protein n=1 Tax=Anaeromyxobacter sp. (strain Fw109-5) TaxID=404589 RepID=UPI0000ED8240|nr:ATP-binding protein [Anaeromyxobacter sp. Fw109-5]ABS26012.1 histidine kinase [Anaeromyxobacter sp. Fw109-5]
MSAPGSTSGGGISLRTRVYLLMGIGIFFPIVLMAAAGLYWIRGFDERILVGRSAAAGAVAAHFDEGLTADLESLQRLASALSAGFGDADHAEEQRLVRAAHESLRYRETIFVLDREQHLLAHEPTGTLTEVPEAARPLVEEVLATGRPRMSGLSLDARGAVVHELVPVRSWTGEVVGVVGGTFRPDRRDFGRMLQHLRRGRSGFADLVDGSGLVVASSDRGRAGKPAGCGGGLRSLMSDRRTTSVSCRGCHQDRSVPELGGEALPDDELLTFAPLGSAPWAVVVRQAIGEALPTQGSLPWYVVGIGLLLQLALVGTFAWGAALSVTRPVGVLTFEAERIARGELDWPIPDLGSDEVGRLGGALERMRGALRGTLAQLAEANVGLEQRVQERTRELNEALARVRERDADRSQLLRKVITAQEDERKRIARELHDETTQSLAVLAMGLEAAQDALRTGLTPRLDEVKAVALRTLEDVHRLILDLRPSVLDDLGLFSAIQWYAERSLETRGISVRCEFGELDRRLPPELETALFRMCQEAMSNVARHAQASAVLVQVGVENGAIQIDIEDDGRGFDVEAAARREGRRPWGLLGIRERAEILGGSARIDSAPGQGTRVQVRVPLPPAEPAQADGAKEGRGGVVA